MVETQQALAMKQMAEWKAHHWLCVACFALLLSAPFLTAFRPEAGYMAITIACVFLFVAVGMSPDDDTNE